MKNKKRNTILGLVLLLVVSATSFAYFTDVKQGSAKLTAGEVSLEGVATVLNVDKVVPGDTNDLVISHKYTGNVAARSRIKFYDKVESVPSTVDEGYTLTNAAPGSEAVLAFGGEAIQYINDKVVQPGEDVTATVTLELLAASGNKFTKSTYEVKYEVQVLQEDHTTWVAVTDGKIVAR